MKTSKFDNIHLMRLYSSIVEHGSFSSAALKNGITSSKASKDIQLLEERLETKLLHRSTRHIRPTDAGEIFYEKALIIVKLYEDLIEEMSNTKSSISGLLRITAPSPWGEYVLTPIIANFKHKFPDVTFDVDISNDLSNIQKENIHIAFRSQQNPDEQFLAKFIGVDDQVICASKEYLESIGGISTLEELKSSDFISLSNPNHRYGHDSVTLYKDQEQFKLPIHSDTVFSCKRAIHRFVLSGLGIAILPKYLVTNSLAEDKLVEVLPNYKVKTSNFYALYSHRRSESSLVNTFLDFVIESITESPSLC